MEAYSSEVFSSTLKPLELEMFVVDGQESSSLDLSLLYAFISSSFPLYGMESESLVFLHEFVSEANIEWRLKEGVEQMKCASYIWEGLVRM